MFSSRHSKTQSEDLSQLNTTIDHLSEHNITKQQHKEGLFEHNIIEQQPTEDLSEHNITDQRSTEDMSEHNITEHQPTEDMSEHNITELQNSKDIFEHNITEQQNSANRTKHMSSWEEVGDYLVNEVRRLEETDRNKHSNTSVGEMVDNPDDGGDSTNDIGNVPNDSFGQRVIGVSDMEEEIDSDCSDLIVDSQSINLDDQITLELNNNESTEIHRSSTSNDLEEEVESVKETGHSYVCSKCKKVFNRLSWFQRHQLKCNLSYQCALCPSILKNQKCLKVHIKKYHGHIFKCSSCDAIFPTDKKLLKHFNKTHDAEKICPQCNSKSKNIKALRKHLKKTCKGTNKDDSIVSANTSDNNPQEGHGTSEKNVVISINDKNQTTCEMDRKRKKTQRKIHAKLAGPTLKCSECSKLFETKSGLRKHMLTHRKFKTQNENTTPVSFIIDNNGFVEIEQEGQVMQVEFIVEPGTSTYSQV